MQTFHSPDWATTLDRLVDLLIERLPVTEWFDTEELEKGIEFLDIILPNAR